MELDEKPDTIMAATDVMAIGAMKYLKYKNYSIPEDVNVVGFDNISLSTLIEPGLTTVAQPINKLGEQAIKILVNKINDDSVQEQKILAGELIIRGSTDENQDNLNILQNGQKKIFY